MKFIFPYDFNDAGFLKDQPNYIPWSFGELKPWFQLFKRGPFTREGELDPLLSPEKSGLWQTGLLSESEKVLARESAVVASIAHLPLRDDAKGELRAQVNRFYSELKLMVQDFRIVQ